jgi:hypothetical protein
VPVERTLLALNDFYPWVECWFLPHVVGLELLDQVLSFEVKMASLNNITILLKSWERNKIKKSEVCYLKGANTLVHSQNPHEGVGLRLHSDVNSAACQNRFGLSTVLASSLHLSMHISF